MFRLSRWLPAALVSGTAIVIASCGTSSTPSTAPRPSQTEVVPPAQIGAPLYDKVDPPELAKSTAVPEPIIIQQATIAYDDKILLAAQADGIVEVIGTKTPVGFVPQPGDPLYMEHPREKGLYYRKLRENDPILIGQQLARQDESQTAIQHDALENSIVAARERVLASEAVVKEAAKVVGLMKKSGTSLVEQANAEASLARSQEGVAESKANLVKLVGERDVTSKKVRQYFLNSTVDGRIYKIPKSPGEFAKVGETVLEIQGTTRFRIEGKVDVQEANRIQLGQHATVEPARPLGPEPYYARHRQEVTAVAVTAHVGRPLVVSAGMDSTVLVWDLTRTQKYVSLPHTPGIGVRSVAATGAKAAVHLVATGSADGRVRIWDTKDPDKLSGESLLGECAEQHAAPVSAAAFTPDGKYLATAAGRDVFLWDVATRTKRYSLPQQHKDDITCITFTPQATLVTISRDKSIRIWNMGVDGASLARTLDHRAGVVDTLGVSSDGGTTLFDQDLGRLDIVSLADGRTVGTLLNSGSTVRFAGLAIYSHDNNRVLTAGGDADSKGELQLWEKPPIDGRGSERRRLITPNHSGVTCAAFSPDDKKRFMVVGTQSGGVHYWLVPAEEAMKNGPEGRVVSILNTDARSATVRVEVDNSAGRYSDWLQDRGTATIIINAPPAK